MRQEGRGLEADPKQASLPETRDLIARCHRCSESIQVARSCPLLPACGAGPRDAAGVLRERSAEALVGGTPVDDVGVGGEEVSE
jgi:hypothetical protein